jgi:GAF domain-containing protein
VEGPDGGRLVLRRFQDLFSLEPEVLVEAAQAAKADFTEQALLNGLPAAGERDSRFLTDPESSDDASSPTFLAARVPEAPQTKDGLHDADPSTRQLDGDHRSATTVETRESETLAGLNGEVPAKAAPPEQDPASAPSVAVPHQPPWHPAQMGGSDPSVASGEQADLPSASPELDPIMPASFERDAATALGIMADISRSILDRNHITQTLSMVLEGIGRIGAFDVVFFALLNPKGDRVFGRLGYGEGVQEPLGSLSVLIRKNSGMIAETILQGTPRIAAHSSAAVLVPEGAQVPPIPGHSFISYPVTVRGKTLGALVAARTQGPAPTEADLAVLSLFCDQACLALEKSVT